MVSPNLLNQVTEPPATLHMTDEEIESVLYLPLHSIFPISSTAVEQAVKDVTRAAMKATTPLDSDGIVQMSITSQKADEI